ncbi:uncharacterized protein LOC143604242 isoform X2 [Bidens hawaiensis]|uniref:uncharacterized protein LOC143604242 isoform X2 n=1 Tax=Bidens hawaiensis TaxID=980011 RepID=UPI00404AD395
MLTLTTTLVSHERLGLIPQMALTEIPRPPTALSTVSPTASMRPPPPPTTTHPPPPPPSDVSFMRITRPQGPVQPVHPSLYNLPPGRQTEMLLNLLHLYENQMAADRQNHEKLMENQQRMMGYISFCQKETKALREIVTSQGVKLKEQEEIILQLTCKDDALKRLKNDDEDPDESGARGEPKQSHGSSTSAGTSGGEDSSQHIIIYQDPTAAKPIEMIAANTVIFVDGSGVVNSVVNRYEIQVGEFVERSVTRMQISILLGLNDDQLNTLEAEPDVEVENEEGLEVDPSI